MTTTSPARNMAEMSARLTALEAKNLDLSKRVLTPFGFENLVTNGGFDADTDWTKGTGWTIAAGVATHATGAASSLTQTGSVINRYYTAQVTVSGRTTGDLFAYFGTTLSSVFATNTTSSVSDLQQGNTNFSIYATSPFDGSVDNVSLWNADASDSAPWLPLRAGYKVGNFGIVTRDGVVLEPDEYEEILWNGLYHIKPVTAPGASTTFRIWGVQA